MKPPNSDANRPGNNPGPRAPEAAKPPASPTTPTATGPKTDASPGKPDPAGGKPAGLPGEGAKPATPGTIQPGAAKPGDSAKAADTPKSAEGLKPGEAPKVVEIGKPSDAKPGAVNPGQPGKQPDPVKDAKVEPGKPDAIKDAPKDSPKTATFPGSGPTPAKPAGAVTDGPIIDLKAKRLPDPPPAQKAAPMGAGPTPNAAPKPGDAKASDAKTSPLGSMGDSTKAASGTTPKISPTPAAAPAARGPGFGSVATAGLLGGVIGAGLLFGIERAGLLPPGDDGRLAALDQRIAALAPKDEVARLSQRVAANETAVKAVPEAVSTAREALKKASAAPAPTEGAAPRDATVPADLVARLDSLDQRVSALQEEPGQQGGDARMAVAPTNTEVTALADRLKALETKAAATGKPAEQPDLAPKLAALQTALDARAKANADAIQGLGQKLTETQQSLDAKVQAATQASQQAAETARTQAAEAAKGIERQVETQIQAQGEKIAGLDKAVSTRAETATVQAALRVVAADRIVTALNTGAPYADALTALRNYEPGDPARLTALAVFADRGAPTARALAAEFRTVADKIAASRRAAQVRSVAETGDFSQKLLSMAESIVQVRKVDTPAPSGQGAAPAADPLPKIQDALDRGAIGDAAQAFAVLPETIRAEAGDFGTRLKSRAAAGEAAQALLAEAFKGLPTASAPR
ncbi:COG4223 family protein [Methylobacterium gossipiicola]|uniref:Uncharacterized conserved protein n=1 Tax=Methylobacterium gossipiicola TaxID=582675 RepID=A0A1I2QFR3_9HYPH|nr:hypothetical protein [Methylobacterium gossipiicola]SFG27128.1 Uncharacterized conserved protein [Methylobacterium gossipiicola]